MRKVIPSEVNEVNSKPDEVNGTLTASSEDDLRKSKIIGEEGEEEREREGEGKNDDGEKGYVQDGPAEESFIPPDATWGWAVAFGCFVISVSIQMIMTGFGVLFSRFLLSLDTSTTMTSWIFCIFLSLFSGVGLFVKPLLEVYGWRPISLTAGFFNSLALIISAFSPSAGFLFFSFSLLSGVASGVLVYICFIILPNFFFHRRGVANAIMMAGISVGQFIGPLIFRYLIDEYGFRGATLIIGALMLHACLGASLFQPVEWHVKKAPQLNEDRPHKTPISLSLESKDTLPQSPSGGSYDTVLPSHEGRTHHDSPKISSTTGIKRSSSSLKGEKGDEEELETLSETIKKTNLEERLRNETLSRRMLYFLKFILADISLISTPKIFIMAFGSICSASSCLNFIMLVPFAMQDAGHTLHSSAPCVSIASVTNLIFILMASSLSDWKRFNIKYCYMAGHLLMAGTIFAFPLVIHDIPSTMVIMALYGTSLGCGIGVFNLVITSVMGAENLPSILGLSTFMIAIGTLLIGPLIGFVRDISGSYAVSIWLLSAIAASTVVLWLFMPAAIRRERRKSSAKIVSDSV